MVKVSVVLLLLIVALIGEGSAKASHFTGPGRFCGYSAIIDLNEDESIETMSGGIHAGGFLWKGKFGVLEVLNIGWASKPPGVKKTNLTSTGQTIFLENWDDGKFQIAIWNRRNGSAYFRSPDEFSDEQMGAIDRVYLFDETESEPKGCKYRTVFSWN